MALPVTRSVLRELDEGMTDGTFKKVVRDRGGIVEPDFWTARRQLSVKLYGIVESPEKVCPCCNNAVHTPYTIATQDPEGLGY